MCTTCCSQQRVTRVRFVGACLRVSAVQHTHGAAGGVVRRATCAPNAAGRRPLLRVFTSLKTRHVMLKPTAEGLQFALAGMLGGMLTTLSDTTKGSAHMSAHMNNAIGRQVL